MESRPGGAALPAAAAAFMCNRSHSTTEDIMLDRQDAVFDAAQRAQHFLDLNNAILSGADFMAARHWLDDVVRSFTEGAEEQGVSGLLAQEETAKQRRLRQKIRLELMAPIGVVARWTLRGVPEFGWLDTPKRPLHEQEFITHARCMADAAALYCDT